MNGQNQGIIKEKKFDAELAEFLSISERVHKAANRLCSISDRFLGCEPKNTTAIDESKPPQDCIVGRVRTIIGDLRSGMVIIEGEVERLESL